MVECWIDRNDPVVYNDSPVTYIFPRLGHLRLGVHSEPDTHSLQWRPVHVSGRLLYRHEGPVRREGSVRWRLWWGGMCSCQVGPRLQQCRGAHRTWRTTPPHDGPFYQETQTYTYSLDFRLVIPIFNSSCQGNRSDRPRQRCFPNKNSENISMEGNLAFMDLHDEDYLDKKSRHVIWKPWIIFSNVLRRVKNILQIYFFCYF